MKNGPVQIGGLVTHFDFAITQDCHDQNWCGGMSPFIRQVKAVLATEYTDTDAS